jgi:NADH-quinone oxidoreductase subunit N
MLTESLMLMKSELLLVLSLFVILIAKIAEKESEDVAAANNRLMAWVNGLLVVNLAVFFIDGGKGSLFGDMFVQDPLRNLQKGILMLGALVVSFTNSGWIRNQRHAHEFYILMLTSLLGMYLMVSTDNLMMFYLGLEMGTIPLAALANFDLDRKRSSEAAFKMIMMSAFASCILLLGLSFVYGMSGTLNIELLSVTFGTTPSHIMVLVLLVAGFGFKISAVPFHLWTADVYEGAPAGVTAFLSVVSKGAALFVMTNVLYKAFMQLEPAWYIILFVLAVATMVIGNLFALRQTNIKRMLAFSSIAQVGFILVGMSSASPAGPATITYFVLVYLVSNLGAFAVVSIISSNTGKEDISDYAGMYRTNPWLTWVMALSLFSLAGIPPAAGFFAKFFLLLAGAARDNWPLLIIASLNMVVALYYYLVVIKTMFTGQNENPISAQKEGGFAFAGMVICLIGVLTIGVYSGVFSYISNLVL